MTRFLALIGMVSIGLGIWLGPSYVRENYTEVYTTILNFGNQFFKTFGIVAFIGLILFLVLRIIYGKKWVVKGGTRFYFGFGLINAFDKFFEELQHREVKKETLSELSAHVVWRLTRIGLFAALVAIIPITLLWIQNNKITDQNFLIESQRRSSLVLLMNNILTDLSKEIRLNARVSCYRKGK